MYDHGSVTQQFIMLADRRAFLTFDELQTELGISYSDLIALKSEFEAGLQRQNSTLHIISRLDLDPPGFEIEV